MAAKPPTLGFVPIVTDTPAPMTAPRVATAVIEVKLAGAVYAWFPGWRMIRN